MTGRARVTRIEDAPVSGQVRGRARVDEKAATVPDAMEPIRLGCYVLTMTGLEVHGEPSFPEHQAVFDFINRAVKASAWWAADWVAYGESRTDWKDRIDHLVDAEFFTAGTLKQYRYVAQNVPPSRRLEGVSFSVHSEVAGLDAKDQRVWLEKAKEAQWTKSEIRAAIRAAARTKILSGQAPTMHTVDVTVRLTVEAENSWAAQEAAWGLVKAAVAGVEHAHVIGAHARLSDRGTAQECIADLPAETR